VSCAWTGSIVEQDRKTARARNIGFGLMILKFIDYRTPLKSPLRQSAGWNLIKVGRESSSAVSYNR
jgi:hypothetical protein